MTPGDVIAGLAVAGYLAVVRDDGFIEFYREGRFIVALKLPDKFSKAELSQLGDRLLQAGQETIWN